ncbi:hypothetical protein [Brachyspira sp. G79]|uniref:hypothetical protein n=1 Tax=Brachyspira sp. G79 TaxID=1358104 RepID=UPI000BBBC8F6|nr:hypothetical protein [Brachyspira sp. G79]PCG20860.1 membrane protein [Brachyspira sp. G79]
MGKIKNVFTMAILHLINSLTNFSLRVLPVFIIILVLLKLSKVLIDLNWYAVLSIVLLEVILIIFSISFNAVFFKKQKDNKNESTENQNNENNESSEIAVKENKFPILNVAAAFFAFLGIIFVILKLFKAVAWNWVWVLSPLWLSTALVILILIICIIVFIVSALSKKNKIDNIDNSSSETSENNNNTEDKVNNSEEKTDNKINNNKVNEENEDNK